MRAATCPLLDNIAPLLISANSIKEPYAVHRAACGLYAELCLAYIYELFAVSDGLQPDSVLPAHQHHCGGAEFWTRQHHRQLRVYCWVRGHLSRHQLPASGKASVWSFKIQLQNCFNKGKIFSNIPLVFNLHLAQFEGILSDFKITKLWEQAKTFFVWIIYYIFGCGLFEKCCANPSLFVCFYSFPICGS